MCVCLSVIGSVKYGEYLKESLNRVEICIIIQSSFIKSLVVRFRLGLGYKEHEGILGVMKLFHILVVVVVRDTMSFSNP